MPSRLDRSSELTQESIALALVPIVATLLSGTEIARTLAAGPGAGIAFPLPTGLPTLWTYVSVPSGTRPGAVGGPLSLVAFVPLFIVGLLVTSALEAGFLGSLWGRITGESGAFIENVKRFTLRLVGVNLLRATIVVAVLPVVLMAPPLAIIVVVGLTYLIYGLPFEIVVRDEGFTSALETTVSLALDGGGYAIFGGAHLVGGAFASAVLTLLVRNGGLLGILLGTVVIAIPAVFIAVYGLLVFHELNTTGPQTAGS